MKKPLKEQFNQLVICLTGKVQKSDLNDKSDIATCVKIFAKTITNDASSDLSDAKEILTSESDNLREKAPKYAVAILCAEIAVSQIIDRLTEPAAG